MITLTADFVAEKNKLENKPIYLYEISDIDGVGTNLYFTSYDDDVSFNSITYLRFPITHESTSENTSGEIDTVNVKVANISRYIQALLEQFNLRGKKVTITLVFANLLTSSLNKIDFIYYVDSYVAGVDTAEFTCTSKFDLLKMELPARRFWRNHCTWKFKSDQCGYVGAVTSCNKTFQACKVRLNQERFGGFPSIPSRQVYAG